MPCPGLDGFIQVRRILRASNGFETPTKLIPRLHSKNCAEVLEINTTCFYGGGSSEEYLRKLQWQDHGLIMDTKYYPTAGTRKSRRIGRSTCERI